MTNAKNLKKGFTLTELIIVIVIIGILAAVLIPSLTIYIGKAKESAAISDAQTILEEYKAKLVEDGDTDQYIVVSNTKNIIVVSGDYCVLFVDGAYSKLHKTTVIATAATEFGVTTEGYSSCAPASSGSGYTWENHSAS